MQKSKESKAHVNIVIFGPTNSGKTTMMHTLIQKIIQTKKQISAEQKYSFGQYKIKKECQRQTNMDNLRLYFQTEKYKISLNEASSHIKNITRKISQADCAIFIVSAAQRQFQIEMSKPIEQIKDLGVIAYTFGIRSLIVCLNKMDNKSVNYGQNRYEFIKNQLSGLLSKVGFRTNKIHFIPISIQSKDNLLSKSDSMQWYKGPTVLQALDLLQVPKRYQDKPLRIVVEQSFKIGGIGTIGIGKVHTGVLKYQSITFAPKWAESSVASMQIYNQSINKAVPGDLIAFNPRRMTVRQVKPGTVIGDTYNDPPSDVQSFIAHIFVLNHPNVIRKGYCPTIYCHATYFPCQFAQLQNLVNKRTGAIIKQHPQQLKNQDAAFILMKPKKRVCVQEFANYPSLGRFIVRDLNKTVAVGIIKSIVKKLKVQSIQYKAYIDQMHKQMEQLQMQN